MFSENLCVFAVKIREKGFQKAKKVFLSSQLILSIGTGMVPSNGMVPSLPVPIVRLATQKLYSIGIIGVGHIKEFPLLLRSEKYLLKKTIIAEVIAEMRIRFFLLKLLLQER